MMSIFRSTLLLALPGILILPLYAQTSPVPNIEKGNSKELNLPSITSLLGKANSPALVNWQKAPDDLGEYLIYSNPPGREEFVRNDLHLIGTELGLIYLDSEERWHLVPSLYKQSVRVVGETEDLLWVEIKDQGLVALDSKWEIVRRLPGVKSYCVAQEAGGFWCLDRISYDLRGNNDIRAQALVEYDLNGKELQRFVTQEQEWNLTKQILPVQKEMGNKGSGFFAPTAIGWAAVDSEAVWVSLNNYNWTPPDSTHLPMRVGRAQLGRLDRATEKFTILPWPTKEKNDFDTSPQQILNLPGSIQWLEWPTSDSIDIYQLDKHTLQTSRAIRLIAPRDKYNVATRGKNLWIRDLDSGNTKKAVTIYSRETLTPIQVSDAGTAPNTQQFFRPNNWDDLALWKWLDPLSDDETGIWFSDPDYHLLHVNDDGSSTSYGVEPILRFTRSGFAVHTPPGQFLWTGSEQLIQVQTDGKAKRVAIGGDWLERREEVRHKLLFLNATSERVWYYNDKEQLVTATADLSNPRVTSLTGLLGTEISSDSYWRINTNKGTIAVANNLYIWGDSGHLLRIDGSTGQVHTVSSQGLQIPDPTKRIEGTFALPDGRIAFKFSAKTEYVEDKGFPFPRTKLLDKERILIFAPVTESWQESDASPKILPLSAGKELYGYDGTQIYRWQEDKWIVVGKRPLAPENTGFAQRGIPTIWPYDKVLSTAKYFYQETVWGLYRVPWSQIGVK